MSANDSAGLALMIVFAGDVTRGRSSPPLFAKCPYKPTNADDYRERTRRGWRMPYRDKFNRGFNLSDEVADSVPFAVADSASRSLRSGYSWKP